MPLRKIKNSILLVLLMLIASPAISQFNTYSPYTRFGLGDFTKSGFGQNLAMGGAGIALHQSDHLNYLNPAAYSARDSMSVLFDFGMNSFFNQYKTSAVSDTWWNGNFHHIALSVPIGKYEVYADDKKIGELTHKPQITKKPFMFEGIEAGKQYVVAAVDRVGRIAKSEALAS
ncbi:hypothetical protein ACFLQX_02645 [Bacteroidota bacterium]